MATFPWLLGWQEEAQGFPGIGVPTAQLQQNGHSQSHSSHATVWFWVLLLLWPVACEKARQAPNYTEEWKSVPPTALPLKRTSCMSFTVSALKPNSVMLYISPSGSPPAPYPHTPFLSVPFSGALLPHWQLMAATNVSELLQLSTKRQNPFCRLCEDPEEGDEKGGKQQQCKPAWSAMQVGRCLSLGQLSSPLRLILPLKASIPSLLAYIVFPVPSTVRSTMLFSFGSLSLPNYLVKQFHGTIINYSKSISQHC